MNLLTTICTKATLPLRLWLCLRKHARLMRALDRLQSEIDQASLRTPSTAAALARIPEDLAREALKGNAPTLGDLKYLRDCVRMLETIAIKDGAA